MNPQDKKNARKELGALLGKKRELKGLRRHDLTKQYGIRFEHIKAIEEGSSNYTVDVLLSYLKAIDYYPF